MKNEKKRDAVVSLKLKAKSGYQTEFKKRISADQWTRINAILEEKEEEVQPDTSLDELKNDNCFKQS